MSISGVPPTEFTRPVADSQSLKEIYDLLFDGWKMVIIEPNMPSKNLENNITWRFYDAIVAEKSRFIDDGTRQYCFSFHSGEGVTDGKGNQTGIADMIVQFGTDERNRFIIEAKLLNKQRASNAGAYVGKDGMGRFMSGKKYGIGVSEGGMMGYVLDGNTAKARKSVTDKIETERQTLGMSPTETLKNSTVHDDVYETSHVRQTGTPFTIYHLFLPVVPHQN